MSKPFIEEKALSHFVSGRLNEQEYLQLIYLASIIGVERSAFVRQSVRYYMAQFPKFVNK